MKVKSITYNWRPVVREVTNGYGEKYVESSCDYDERTVGQEYYVGKDIPNKVCVSIVEHLPQFAGDALYYDVYYNNDTMVRIFNINEVIYETK